MATEGHPYKRGGTTINMEVFVGVALCGHPIRANELAVFFSHGTRFLIVTQRDETRVAQVITFGPFGEFDLSY